MIENVICYRSNQKEFSSHKASSLLLQRHLFFIKSQLFNNIKSNNLIKIYSILNRSIQHFRYVAFFKNFDVYKLLKLRNLIVYCFFKIVGNLNSATINPSLFWVQSKLLPISSFPFGFALNLICSIRPVCLSINLIDELFRFLLF